MKSYLKTAARRLCVTLLFVLFCTSEYAQAQSLQAQPSIQPESLIPFSPNVKPQLDLQLAPEAITVDGDLSDAGWQKASKASNFSELQPNEGAKPLIESESWITYDTQNLYVAFIVKDDPTKIRATNGKRDNVFNDDWVAITIDTFNNNAYFLLIGANPKGIQVDTRGNGNNDDDSYNVIYQSAGKITENGYQVEMAIPFASLSFPTKPVQSWSINFMVNHPRDTRRMYLWAGYDSKKGCVMCQFGKINNLQNIKSSGQQIQFIPALVGSTSGTRDDSENPNSTFKQNKIAFKSFDPSLNIRYNINSNSSAELAVNPDFSQIEADESQIDVNNTFALFFSERRPFFQEGADLFDNNSGFNFGPSKQMVYTRSINNPIVATKFTGRFGKTSVGYIGARDENSPLILPFGESSEVLEGGKSLSNIVRIRRNFEGDNYLGGFLTDRRLDAKGSGSLAGIDGTYRLSKVHQLSVEVYGSHTQELNDAKLSADNDLSGKFDEDRHTVALDGESFTGHSEKISFIRSDKNWTYFVGYEATSPTFRADNGFVTSNDMRQINLFQQYQFYPKNSFFSRIAPWVIGGQVWDHVGNRRDQFVVFGGNANMKGQLQVNFNAQAVSNETFRGQNFYGMQSFNVNVNANPKQWLGGGFYMGYGERIRRTSIPQPGLGLDGGAWLNFKPFSSLSISPQVNYSQMKHRVTGEEFYRGYILRLSTDFQASKALSFRAIAEYNDFSKGLGLQPLITYQVNPFTVFYLGANMNTRKPDLDVYPNFDKFYKTDQILFFKMQYLFKR
jgi:hypothetical protein